MSRYTIEDELYNCFRYFMDFTNFNESSKGYGLTLDNTTKHDFCSIAASGFMLASLVIGVSRKYIDYDTALIRARKTIENFATNIEHYLGFFVHFVDIKKGERFRKCEYSTIDTNLLINGMLVCDNYFDDESIHQNTKIILDRILWHKFLGYYDKKLVIRMAYNDIVDGDYRNGDNSGFIYQWHMYAEQLSMYLLAAGSGKLSKENAIELFNGFRRDKKKYLNQEFTRCPTGSLFTYQFSHCFFDFSKYLDTNGYDWFLNSKLATYDNLDYCYKHYEVLKEKGIYGISASDGPFGYRGYGVPPYDYDDKECNEPRDIDGTVAPYAFLSSIIFDSELAIKTLDNLTSAYPEIIGEYGLKDAINFSGDKVWVSNRYFGIDKGITLMMLENHLTGLIHELYTTHPLIQKALEILEFRKK